MKAVGIKGTSDMGLRIYTIERKRFEQESDMLKARLNHKIYISMAVRDAAWKMFYILDRVVRRNVRKKDIKQKKIYRSLFSFMYAYGDDLYPYEPYDLEAAASKLIGLITSETLDDKAQATLQGEKFIFHDKANVSDKIWGILFFVPFLVYDGLWFLYWLLEYWYDKRHEEKEKSGRRQFSRREAK
jgi:hypothetical protein